MNKCHICGTPMAVRCALVRLLFSAESGTTGWWTECRFWLYHVITPLFALEPRQGFRKRQNMTGNVFYAAILCQPKTNQNQAHEKHIYFQFLFTKLSSIRMHYSLSRRARGRVRSDSRGPQDSRQSWPRPPTPDIRNACQKRSLLLTTLSVNATTFRVL